MKKMITTLMIAITLMVQIGMPIELNQNHDDYTVEATRIDPQPWD